MNEQYGLTVENLLNVLPDVLRQDEKLLALATGVAELLPARPPAWVVMAERSSGSVMP